MNGRPLLRVLVLGVVLAAIGAGLARVTGKHSMRAPVAQIEQPESATILMVESTGLATFDLTHAERLLARVDQPSTHFEGEARLALRESVDVLVRARWVESHGPQAIRIRADRDGEAVADTTLWGTNSVEDVVRIPSKK